MHKWKIITERKNSAFNLFNKEINSHGREEKRREDNTTLLTNRLQFKLLKILLSLILSFSISCKSNEEPNGTPPPEPIKPPEEIPITPKHELEGTWIGYDKKDTKHEDYKLELKIDSDGNITFSPRPYPQEKVKSIVTNITTNNTVTITNIVINTITNTRNYTYNGKIYINSIVYPFTNDVNCYSLTIQDDGYGKFIFSSPSNCTAKYDRIDFEYKDGYINLTSVTVDFTKQ